jgi:acyl-CoA synthetase (AMP-forming)/AMP-acid ligase II
VATTSDRGRGRRATARRPRRRARRVRRAAADASAGREELLHLCIASLARYKVPREIIVIDALPKNAVGKISKPVFYERFG